MDKYGKFGKQKYRNSIITYMGQRDNCKYVKRDDYF